MTDAMKVVFFFDWASRHYLCRNRRWRFE